VLRIDQPIPAEMAGKVTQDKDQKLYYEIAI
jgi:hypothetical protein